MAVDKDSAVLIIETSTNGKYWIQLAQWDQSPPQIPQELLLAIDQRALVQPAMRTEVANDKAELKTKLNAWIDNLFDQ